MTSQAAPQGGVRVRVQRFGTFLSNMVMPNIGAFIAWGLITALFIEVGWLAELGIGDDPGSWVAEIGGWGEFAGGGIVGPMITYLLPVLIGYTGGRMVYETRGGVVGAIATFGVIAGTEIPMFMGAMIMGPLGGWTMKNIDAIWDGKIRPGFEMLVNNFSAGIWGMLLATFGFFGMSPILTRISDEAGDGVGWLVDHDLLPFTSLLIEPAKVLFLNNAINHGVLTPLGSTEALEQGKSVLFLLEANPAAGLGLLLAYSIFGKGLAKASAPGAAIIHFFGGIHEIYFPYVLMKPKLILAMFAGGMTQIFINVLFDSGLRAPAAPGSVIAVYAQTPGDSVVGVTLSIIGGAAASFVVAAFLLKTDKTVEAEDELVGATQRMEAMKGRSSIASSALVAGAASAATGPIRSIVFACDAGMGSSAMGASVLRKKVHGAGFTDVTVVNKAIANLTDDHDLVVSHQDLTERAALRSGSAVHVSVENFMDSPAYDEIVELVRQRNGGGGPAPAAAPEPTGSPVGGDLLSPDSVVLGAVSTSRDDAITRAGELLIAAEAVDASYVAAMHERERSVSTFMGNGLALPHGTNEAKPSIRRTAVSFVRYDDGVDWNGKQVKFVVGVAARGDDHLKLLARIAEIFVDKEQVARLEAATSPDEVVAILGAAQPA
ncbi:PTS mannitol transporter subunit IICBA [Nocardioides silvaticus]|nr:PTS mannitol transporter subunit IICBA [Nocardioides silvaticus]